MAGMEAVTSWSSNVQRDNSQQSGAVVLSQQSGDLGQEYDQLGAWEWER
jgi:hypothetical protein